MGNEPSSATPQQEACNNFASVPRIPSSELFCLTERELLSKLFKNLVQRSQHPRCIDKATFCRVFPLPGVLGERLFRVFDKDNTELITHDEFFDGVAIVLKGSIEDKIKFLFNVMDLDEQNKISRTDLETVLNCIISAQQSWLNDNHTAMNKPPFTTDKHVQFQSGQMHSTMQGVIDCQMIVDELLEDAFAHCSPQSEYLTLREFAGWIVEHHYLWQVIEDTFKLHSSTYNTSLTPGLRRRRSESLSSMISEFVNFADHNNPHAHNTIVHTNHPHAHNAHHWNTEHASNLKENRKVSKSLSINVSHNHTNDELYHKQRPRTPTEVHLIDNVLEPKESFSNQLILHHVSSHGKLNKLATNNNGDDDCKKNDILDGNVNQCSSVHSNKRPRSQTMQVVPSSINGNVDNKTPYQPGSPLLGGVSNNNNNGALQRTKSLYQLHTQNLRGMRVGDSTPLIPDMFGYLNKIGRRLQLPVRRWYLLHGNFLYVFRTATDTKPRHVILLQGCQIKTHCGNGEEFKYGIDIVIGINTIRHQRKILYASNEQEQYRWINALKQSADAFVIEDFFNIHEKLGSGKFSTVYRATDKKNESLQYAVKIIQRRSLSARENKALRTEIAVLRMLNHPNVISIKHVFETVENICIVMQYVRGGDLFDRIVEKKRFSEHDAKLVMFKLLKVILYLHKRGIVHRDLKPENILVLNKEKIDEILVIDFGLSSFFTPKELLKSPCGTLSYVAPEVLKGHGYGREVDLWSAGVILYVMLRGKLPFDSNNKKNDKTSLIRKVISGRFSMRNEIWRLRSNNCKDLIIRLLCVDREKRLTAQNALRHPWFNSIVDNDLSLLSLHAVPEKENENENEDEKEDDVVDTQRVDKDTKPEIDSVVHRTKSF